MPGTRLLADLGPSALLIYRAGRCTPCSTSNAVQPVVPGLDAEALRAWLVSMAKT